MRFLKTTVVALVAAGALVATTVPAMAVSHATVPTVKASTTVTNRPDSGAHGNDWALDNFKRFAQVSNLGAVATSHCGGAKTCFHFGGLITDTGSFTTMTGVTVPGFGGLNGGPAPKLDVAVTGSMSGTYNYDFYSNWKTINASFMPLTENGSPVGRQTTGAWLAQFFLPGASFWSASGIPLGHTGTGAGSLGTGVGSWLYTTAFGSDPACPRVASQWWDASPDWGTLPASGNVFAPNAAHC